MPVIFRSGSYRFFFYSNEGRPRETPHIHVEQGESEAKFWLRPDVSVAYNDGFSARALNALMRMVEANRERIETAWDEFFR